MRSRIAVLVVVLTLVSCRHAAPPPSVTLLGTTVPARQVVIVFDFGDWQEVDIYRSFIRAAVERLTPAQSFNLILCDNHEWRCDLRTRELLAATPENKAKVLDFMEKAAPPLGHTNASPIEVALRSSPDAVFLVNTAWIADWPGLAESVRSLNASHRARIYTVTFDDEDQSHPARVMRQIAGENGGTFNSLRSADLFRKITP